MSCNCNNNSGELSESNVSACGDVCPTTCTTQVAVNTCGCNNQCGCNNASASVCTPYYNAAVNCQESHARVCIQSQYVTGLSISNLTAMPACGQTTVLVVPGIQLINIGVYLWNPTFGYLRVTAFDYANSMVTVINDCQSVNAAPGTLIPSCTVFTVSDSPNSINSACTEDPVDEGVLLVCSGGTAAPLGVAPTAGQVPVATGVGDNVSFETLNLDAVLCTELTADVVLQVGLAGPYAITVTDTTGFLAGDIVRFQRYTDGTNDLIINTITGPLSFVATMLSNTLVADETIPAGENICIAPCCVQLDYFMSNPCSWDLSDRFLPEQNSATIATLAAGALLVGQTQASNEGNLLIENPSCTPMFVDVFMSWAVLTASSTAFSTNSVNLQCQFASVTGPIGTTVAPAPVTIVQCWRSTASTHIESLRETNIRYITIPAGHELRMRVGAILLFAIETLGGTTLNWSEFGIALRTQQTNT